MRALMLCLPILLTLGFTTAAVSHTSSISPGERIQLVERAVSGDFEALEALNVDGETGRWDLLLRGYALAATGQDNEAIETWEQAADLGLHLAVKALASHHYEHRNWTEAYAWARLAMEIEGALKDSTMDDLRGSWSLYTAVQSADSLERDQHQAADALALERVNHYLPRMIAPGDVGSEDGSDVKDLEIVERTAPVFPRSMAENGRPGWSYIQLEILPNGRVGEVAAVAASHDRFARAAVRAIRKWRFNVDAMDELPATGFQQIDFTLQR